MERRRFGPDEPSRKQPEGSDDHHQPVAQHNRQQHHHRRPGDKHRHRINEQERHQRDGLNRFRGQAERAADAAESLHQDDHDQGRNERRADHAENPARKQFDIGDGPRVEHLDHTLPTVPGTHVEGQEDHAEEEYHKQEHAHLGHDEPRRRHHRGRRDPAGTRVHYTAIDEPDEGQANGQHAEHPRSHLPPGRARFREGHRPSRSQPHAVYCLFWPFSPRRRRSPPASSFARRARYPRPRLLRPPPCRSQRQRQTLRRLAAPPPSGRAPP